MKLSKFRRWLIGLLIGSRWDNGHDLVRNMLHEEYKKAIDRKSDIGQTIVNTQMNVMETARRCFNDFLDTGKVTIPE